MIHFNEVFSSQISVKKISIGLISSISILLLLISFFSLFIDTNNNDAAASTKTYSINYSGKQVEVPGKETCWWECSPCDMSCYTSWDKLGPKTFTLRVETSFGEAHGEAECHDPGLRDPGNFDIRGREGGVSGDSHGYCTIEYIGYWIEDGIAYHHWIVYNDDHVMDGYQKWSGNFKAPVYGSIFIEKDSLWKWTERCSEYSFEGCTFYIYNTRADAETRTNSIGKVVLGQSGLGSTEFIYPAEKTFYLRESNKPGEHGKGYLINEDIGYTKIVPDSISYVTWSDKNTIIYDAPLVANAFLNIQKTDAQTNSEGVTEGSVESFENAYYEIEYRCGGYKNDIYKWIIKTNAEGVVGISEEFRDNKIDGDDFLEWDGKIVAPMGTYYIHEVKAPEGYLISNKNYKAYIYPDPNNDLTCAISFIDLENGEALEHIVDPQTGNLKTKLKEQVIRGDYKFLKVDEQERTLAGIPFKITSQTTGEWHICVSDSDGIIDTSSTHYAHTNNTNFNDSLYNEETNTIDDEESLTESCGIWFAYDKKTEEIAQANDELGAFPYDTYTIEEIPISTNKKYLPFETRTFVVNNHGYLIEGPEWVNKESIIPVIPINEILPHTGDVPLWIFGLPILAVLCYIIRRWVYCRKY